MAFAISGILGFLNLVLRTRHDSDATVAVVFGFAISFFINFLIIWAVYWWVTPPRTGTEGGLAWLMVPILIAGLIYLAADGIASDNSESNFGAGGFIGIAVFVLMAGWGVLNQFTVVGQGDATHFATLANVVREASSAYPDTDANHIVTVPQETAIFKASQVVAKQSVDGRNLATAYNPGTPQLMSVNEHLYWISPLEFTGWQAWDQVGQVSPGFIAIDAEDPDAEPQLHLGFKMKYTPNAFFGNKLSRHIYDGGITNRDVDDLTMEVDDNWKPFYTASLNRKTLRSGASVPQEMIVVDPQTGEIKKYGLDEIPDWVDRVYSQNTVLNMVNWWGDYGDPKTAPFRFLANRPNTGRYKVADKPTLVYTKSGHPAWQMILTSLNKDTSIVDVALFDARDNEVRLYPIIAGTATEGAVIKAFESIQANVKNWEAKHLSMHKIYGYPTWVVSYVSKSADGSQGEPFQGIGLINANDLQGASVVFARNKEEALSLYRQAQARRPKNDSPEENKQIHEAKGTVKDSATQIVNGNTVYFFVLSESPTRVFKAGKDVSIELPFAKVGDQVVIQYIDVGGPGSVYDVAQFNDLAVPIVP